MSEQFDATPYIGLFDDPVTHVRKFPQLDLRGNSVSLPADTQGIGGGRFVVPAAHMSPEDRDAMVEKILAASATQPAAPRPADLTPPYREDDPLKPKSK